MQQNQHALTHEKFLEAIVEYLTDHDTPETEADFDALRHGIIAILKTRGTIWFPIPPNQMVPIEYAISQIDTDTMRAYLRRLEEIAGNRIQENRLKFKKESRDAS
jgi:hypothetical protein